MWLWLKNIDVIGICGGEKMKKSASLSKLREKELVKFQKQVLDEEELAVDDVASSRYKR